MFAALRGALVCGACLVHVAVASQWADIAVDRVWADTAGCVGQTEIPGLVLPAVGGLSPASATTVPVAQQTAADRALSGFRYRLSTPLRHGAVSEYDCRAVAAALAEWAVSNASAIAGDFTPSYFVRSDVRTCLAWACPRAALAATTFAALPTGGTLPGAVTPDVPSSAVLPLPLPAAVGRLVAFAGDTDVAAAACSSVVYCSGSGVAVANGTACRCACDEGHTGPHCGTAVVPSAPTALVVRLPGVATGSAVQSAVATALLALNLTAREATAAEATETTAGAGASTVTAVRVPLLGPAATVAVQRLAGPNRSALDTALSPLIPVAVLPSATTGAVGTAALTAPVVDTDVVVAVGAGVATTTAVTTAGATPHAVFVATTSLLRAINITVRGVTASGYLAVTVTVNGTAAVTDARCHLEQNTTGTLCGAVSVCHLRLADLAAVAVTPGSLQVTVAPSAALTTTGCVTGGADGSTTVAATVGVVLGAMIRPVLVEPLPVGAPVVAGEETRGGGILVAQIVVCLVTTIVAVVVTVVALHLRRPLPPFFGVIAALCGVALAAYGIETYSSDRGKVQVLDAALMAAAYTDNGCASAGAVPTSSGVFLPDGNCRRVAASTSAPTAWGVWVKATCAGGSAGFNGTAMMATGETLAACTAAAFRDVSTCAQLPGQAQWAVAQCATTLDAATAQAAVAAALQTPSAAAQELLYPTAVPAADRGLDRGDGLVALMMPPTGTAAAVTPPLSDGARSVVTAVVTHPSAKSTSAVAVLSQANRTGLEAAGRLAFSPVRSPGVGPETVPLFDSTFVSTDGPLLAPASGTTAPFLRLERIDRGGALDLGGMGEFTVTLWLRLSRRTAGFAFAVIDDVHDAATLDHVALGALDTALRTAGKDVRLVTTAHGLTLYSALHIDGGGQQVSLLFSKPGDTPGVMTWAPDGTALPDIFDDRWHFVAVSADAGGGSIRGQLYVDGQTFRRREAYVQCITTAVRFPRVTELPEDAPLRSTPAPAAAGAPPSVFPVRAYRRPALYAGRFDGGVYGLEVFGKVLGQQVIGGLGSRATLRAATGSVTASRAWGVVFAVFFVIGAAAQAWQSFRWWRDVRAEEAEEERHEAEEEEDKAADFRRSSLAEAEEDALIDEEAAREHDEGQADDERPVVRTAVLSVGATQVGKGLSRLMSAVRSMQRFSKATSGGQTALKQLAVIVPVFGMVSQSMVLFFQNWEWPALFRAPFSWAFFSFSWDIGAVFDTVVPEVSFALQFAGVLLAVWVVYLLAVHDDDEFREQVVDPMVEAKCAGRHPTAVVDYSLPTPCRPAPGLLHFTVGDSTVRGVVGRGLIQAACTDAVEPLYCDSNRCGPPVVSGDGACWVDASDYEAVRDAAGREETVVRGGADWAGSDASVLVTLPGHVTDALEFSMARTAAGTRLPPDTVPGSSAAVAPPPPETETGAEAAMARLTVVLLDTLSLLGFQGKTAVTLQLYQDWTGRPLTDTVASVLGSRGDVIVERLGVQAGHLLRQLFPFFGRYHLFVSSLGDALAAVKARVASHARRSALVQFNGIVRRAGLSVDERGLWKDNFVRRRSKVAEDAALWAAMGDEFLASDPANSDNVLLAPAREEAAAGQPFTGDLLDSTVHREAVARRATTSTRTVAPVVFSLFGSDLSAASDDDMAALHCALRRDAGLRTHCAMLRYYTAVVEGLRACAEDEIDYAARVAAAESSIVVVPQGDAEGGDGSPREGPALPSLGTLKAMQAAVGAVGDAIGAVGTAVTNNDGAAVRTNAWREAAGYWGLLAGDDAYRTAVGVRDHLLDLLRPMVMREVRWRRLQVEFDGCRLLRGRVAAFRAEPEGPVVLRFWPFDTEGSASPEAGLPITVDAELVQCPVHKRRIIPAVEAVHGEVITRWEKLHGVDRDPAVNKSVDVTSDGIPDRPYGCVLGSNAVFNTMCFETMAEALLPCDDKVYVCPNNRCGFAVCSRCARLKGVAKFRATFHGQWYSIQRRGLMTLVGFVVILVAQLLYQPAVESALRLVSCHETLTCRWPNCWDPADGSFLLMVSIAILVLIVAGAGLPVLFFLTAYRRKQRLLDSGALDCEEPLFWFKSPSREWPVRFHEVVSATLSEGLWLFVTTLDQSLFKTIYEQYEFRCMVIHAPLLLFKVLLVAVTLFWGEPNSLEQIAAAGVVESLQLVFFVWTDPYTDPWIDALSKAGALHQVGQVALLCFYRAEIVDDPDHKGLPVAMVLLAALYIVLLIAVLAVVVVVPVIQMIRESSAAEKARKKAEEEEVQRQLDLQAAGALHAPEKDDH